MVKVNLYGKLGKDIGSEWTLDVSSVQEAFRAIEANTRKLKKWMFNEGSQYNLCILINKKPIIFNEKENIKSSEIFCIFGNKLKSIDVIPEIGGSFDFSFDFGGGGGGGFGGGGGGGGGGWEDYLGPAIGITSTLLGAFGGPYGSLAGGALSIGAGIYLDNSFSPYLVTQGLALIAGGVTSLLAKSPPNVPYQAQQATTATQGAVGQGGGPQSYLFNGPVNIAGEGGPVPVGYGQLMVGSNAINVFYENIYLTNRRTVFTDEADTRFLQDTDQGYQFPFNEQMMLINQKAGWV
jgi:hypothetical protein